MGLPDRGAENPAARLRALRAREFSGKRLRELTVHHKDGNHDARVTRVAVLAPNQPLFRRPAATPLMVRWIAASSRASLGSARWRRRHSTCTWFSGSR